MAGVQIVVSSRKLNAAIKRAEDACKNTLPYWRAMGKMLIASVHRNFAAGGRPDKWAPLDPEYAAWRAKHAPGRILVRESALRDSVFATPDERGVTIGAKAPYATIHQRGGRAGRGGRSRIPARPFLVIQDEDKAQLVEQFEKRVARAWK